ncbi:MAG: DUF433 domain-containing protein [Thermoproteota archaeon]|nr:DUF433 domain-containing protein [Candidatus Brockarchaeota archaeon]
MRVEINEYIVIDTEICHGKPTFKGTRIMVWQVLEMLKAGYGFEDILREFPTLTVEHIRAALDFAAKKVAGESLVPA